MRRVGIQAQKGVPDNESVCCATHSCTAEQCGTTDAIADPNPKLYLQAFKPRSGASDVNGHL